MHNLEKFCGMAAGQPRKQNTCLADALDLWDTQHCWRRAITHLHPVLQKYWVTNRYFRQIFGFFAINKLCNFIGSSTTPSCRDGLGAGRPRSRCLIHGKGKTFFFIASRPADLRPSPLSSGYRGVFLRAKAAVASSWQLTTSIPSALPPSPLASVYRGVFLRAKAAVASSWQLTTSNAEVKITWSYTSTRLHGVVPN
jgi:hypothetical protein